MSRFADPTATRTVDLGPCECPGTPHSGDWAKVRADLSATEIAILMGLDQLDQDGAADAVVPFVVEWNLLGTDGKPARIDAEAMFDLKGPTANAIGEGLNASLRENLNLPNPSGDPSPGSPPAKPSRTPRARRTPTT